jgi:hypothetical protein
MRRTLCVILVVLASLAVGRTAAAQTDAAPTIHRVTLDERGAVLTISGTGLSAHLIVAVDGQPATVLSGATAVQMEVLAPATFLTTPGTYRLTVVGCGCIRGDEPRDGQPR